MILRHYEVNSPLYENWFVQNANLVEAEELNKAFLSAKAKLPNSLRHLYNHGSTIDY